MTWVDTVSCTKCRKKTSQVISWSSIGPGPHYKPSDGFTQRRWGYCQACHKPYCDACLPAGDCELCVSGADQPLAEPQGVIFTLELSADECQALANVFGKVGGDPVRSQRRFINSLDKKLTDLGFMSQHGNVTRSDPNGYGGIYFEHDRHLKHVFPPGVRKPRGE